MWCYLQKLQEKSYISITETAASIWIKTLVPEQQEQPTAEQQTAKKEKKEEASPTAEQPQQPLTGKTTPRPVKVNREEVVAATSLVDDLVNAWNDNVSIGKKDINRGGFQPHVIDYIETLAKKCELNPVSIVATVAKSLHTDDSNRYENASPGFVFNSKGDRFLRGLFWDRLQAYRDRMWQKREDDLEAAAYRGITQAASEQGVSPPTLDRMRAGFNQHASGAELVALGPAEVMMNSKLITRHNWSTGSSSSDDTESGLIKVYGTPSPTPEARLDRDCELMEKVFYAVAKVVGADSMAEYGARNKFDAYDLFTEAAEIN